MSKGIPFGLKKSGRDEHHSVIERETGIHFVRLLDNNIVTAVSHVKRYSHEKKLLSPKDLT